MKVSIIIPYLEIPAYPDAWMIECLESIKAQDYTNYEVIWIGDVPREAFAHVLPMTVISTGVRIYTARAVNQAVRVSCGDLVFALSSNDTIAPGALSACVRALSEDEKAEWWCPNGNAPCEEYMRNAIMCGSIVLRKASFVRLGGYMEWPGINGRTFPGLEDWHLWMRVYKGNVKGISDSRQLFAYRLHPNGACGSQDIISSWAFAPKLAWMRETAEKFGEDERIRIGG